jgi:hypothetical protein
MGDGSFSLLRSNSVHYLHLTMNKATTKQQVLKPVTTVGHHARGSNFNSLLGQTVGPTLAPSAYGDHVFQSAVGSLHFVEQLQ